MVSGGMSLPGREGGVLAVCSVAALWSVRHGRKGGGDKPCQDVPAGTAWHDVAEDFPRTLAEWRSGGVTKWQPRGPNAATPTYSSAENLQKKLPHPKRRRFNFCCAEAKHGH